MESGSGGASNKGFLIPVSDSSYVFQSSILAPLQSAYLYEESKQCFRYKSAVLVKNPELEEKYNAFRAKKRNAGYSESDLKESYGFLLFDDSSKANALGESGVLTRNSTCTTLGDPSKGVYISIYSDCLDPNRWYHGKSGYIAIIRLTKGKVEKVAENYTQNYTEPTVGFDCHVSEQLPSVSAKTSSFLAFERTQFYIYELLDDGSYGTTPCPSSVCPFAIVSFSYTDTKETLPVVEVKSEVKKLACHYLPWKGQLEINGQNYTVELKPAVGVCVPAKLPSVVKVDKIISMSDIRQLLPRAVFEPSCSDEVFHDGFYCSLCEIMPSDLKESSPFAQLLQQIKERDVYVFRELEDIMTGLTTHALAIALNDGGFLLLLHPSYFLTYDDCSSTAAEALQGIFVFPDSRVVRGDTKFGKKNSAISSEILQILPVLSYVEAEIEKTPMDSSEELCDVLTQHMQQYATLINPGLATSPSREVSIFPDQYDIADAHKSLYSFPEWTNRGWQSLKSYLNKPASFQLPLSKVSEILIAGQEERREDLVDDVYICLSSPEDAPASPVSMELGNQQSPVNVETSVDIDISGVEPQGVSQNVVADILQVGSSTKDDDKCIDPSVLNKSDNAGTLSCLTPPTSEDLPTELIVSITSAERTVTHEMGVVSTVSTPKLTDLQFSDLPVKAKLQTADFNSLNDETDKMEKATNLTGTKKRKRRTGRYKAQKKAPKAHTEPPSFEPISTPVEVANLNSNTDNQVVELEQFHVSNPTKRNWRKFQRRKHRFGKPSPKSKKGKSATVTSAKVKESDPKQQILEDTVLMELEALPLKKKTERWDLKPVISNCGRILVPHGSIDNAEQVKSLIMKFQSTKADRSLYKMLIDTPVNEPVTVEMEQESRTTSEMAVDETGTTKPMDGGKPIQSVLSADYDKSVMRQSEHLECSASLTQENNATSTKDENKDTPQPLAILEEQIEFFCPVKPTTKGEFLLSKLKSVLSRRKRKPDLLVTVKETENTAKEREVCLKKAKVDFDIQQLISSSGATQTTNVGFNVSKMPSVDPVFAFALGLTPKNKPVEAQRTKEQDGQQKKDLETKEHTSLDEQHQIIQKRPSIFPKGGRIKTLKKHQGISAENVKKKWWLHFQTPACYASEKVKYNSCTRDNSVSKTAKEKMKTVCSSTDALNLLADLALSASNDQVPPQPKPALERKPETSVKKCDLTKGLTSDEQESVLHALLRQPAARSIPSLESSSPSPLVANTDLVGMVSKEHAYSLPPSSSLLLGLPGTPFQVAPLSGSTRLLQHHQIMYGDGAETLHPSVIYEDISEHTRTSDYLHRRRPKFNHSRTFIMKDGSIQVTKHWQENYDFTLDSRFTSHPKDKVVIRALHGPWDFSIHDTNEEVRLIFHMWIGLFYSRSTARFFQVDSSSVHPFSEGSDSLQKACEMELDLAMPELRANTSGSLSSETNTSVPFVSQAMDLGRKDDIIVEPEPVILDLSLKNSSAETETLKPQVNRTLSSSPSEPFEHVEVLEALKVPTQQHEASTFQCEKKIVDSSETRSMANDPLPTAVWSEESDATSFRDDRTLIPLQEEMQSQPVEPEADSTVLESGQSLDENSNDIALMRDDSENYTEKYTEKSRVQKDGMDESDSLLEKKVEFSKEENGMVHSGELDEPNKVHKNHVMANNLCLEDSSPKMIHTDDDLANKETDIRSKDFLKNKKLLTLEEHQAIPPDQNDNLTRDGDFTSCEGSQLEDDHLREEKLVEKASSISAIEVDRALKDQPLPKMCDGPVKDDCFSENSLQVKMDELLPPEDTKKYDIENLCSDLSELKDLSPVSNTPDTPAEIKLVFGDPGSKENLDADTYQVDKSVSYKPLLTKSDVTITSFDSSLMGLSSLQTTDSAEMGDENQVSDLNSDPNSTNNGSQETKSVEREENTDRAPEKEPFIYQSHSPKSKVIYHGEVELSVTKEKDIKKDAMKGELTNCWGGVEIPFIGIDTSEIDVVQPQDDLVEAVKGQKAIPFISETSSSEIALANEVCTTSQICGKEAEQSSLKKTLLDVSETHEQIIIGSVFDRCPTPTIDERPFEYLSSQRATITTPALSHTEMCRDITQTCPSQISVPAFEQKVQPSTVNTNHSLNHWLHSDLEERTLRVLQSIKTCIPLSNHMDIPQQTETSSRKKLLDQTCTGKSIPTCLVSNKTSVDVKDKKTDDKKSMQSQFLPTKPSDNILLSSYKLEKVLDVELPLRTTAPAIPPHNLGSVDELENPFGTNCHLSRSFVSNHGLQEEQKSSQSNEYRPHNQRPVMAVKPSKSDENQALCFSKDLEFDTNPQSNWTNALKLKHSTPNSMVLEMTDIEGGYDGLNHIQDNHEFSYKSTSLSNVSHNKSNADGGRFALSDPPHQYQRRNFSKFQSLPASKKSFESAESHPEFVSGKQAFLFRLNDTVNHTAEEINPEECLDESFMYHKDDGMIEDKHIVGPHSSLVCTVFNSNQKSSCTLLEQLSQRCIQVDVTQASLEQESLIFSEQMKNLLKKSTRGPICQESTADNLKLSCTSPMTVNFSCLEEEEDSLDFLDTSLVGRKIKVDMSNRKDLKNPTEEEKWLHPQDAANPMEHAVISDMTAESAKLYEAKMHDVCSAKKAPYRHKALKVDPVNPKTQPSNPFDFCNQMKKELDETFRTNLNAVVKKSCKTKYRFHILVTSEDAFFKETKAHVEAEGHTAVQASEFFLGEEGSSSLFIILRNEDIEEHICKVPHLLQLKMTPGVQFAGIDEPDDVVNLTHQELFTRGGYVMFDRAVLEPLSLSKMKQISETLQELSRMGKWRWILHYRDSRRLKENARLSAEANEKKHFLYWGQDAGILEVLPYHECDLMSVDQPAYLTCLLRLQVQNISSRYTVFITDATDSAFEKNGILTMTLNTFLAKSSSQTFSV